MSLSTARVSAQVPVSDLARADAFYAGVLGLAHGPEQHDASREYACGAGTSLHVYVSPEHAGTPTGTVARFIVADLAPELERVRAAGVEPEHYGPPVVTDARGIHDTGYGLAAWVRDPDGNTYELSQPG